MSATIEAPDDGAFVVFRPELYVEPSLIQSGESEGRVYHFVPSGVVASMGGNDQHAFVTFKLDDALVGSMRIPWAAIHAALATRPPRR